MIVKLLTEHHLEFLGLKGGFRGSSESTLVKMPHCWKSHVTAQIQMYVKFVDLFSFDGFQDNADDTLYADSSSEEDEGKYSGSSWY